MGDIFLSTALVCRRYAIVATQFKTIRSAYGFEDVAIVPGDVTVNPDQTSTDLEIGTYHLSIPILASAMDAVVSPSFAAKMHHAGGLGVMNLEGLQTRYDNPEEKLALISKAPKEDATSILQALYSAPIRDELIGKRIQEINATGATCAVSVTPQNAKRMAPAAVEAGAGMIVVQSTVTTARHISTRRLVSPRGTAIAINSMYCSRFAVLKARHAAP